MHKFWSVKRTRIYDVIHADMNHFELKVAYITSTYHGVPRVKVSQYVDVCPTLLSYKVCCASFSIFLLSVFRFGMTVANELKKGRARHFVRKCLGRKWGIRRGENEPSATIGPLPSNAKADWLCRNHKKIPLADSLSLPSDTRTHRHENEHFIILLTFSRNDFIMGIIA